MGGQFIGERKHVSKHFLTQFRGATTIELHRRRKTPRAKAIKEFQKYYYLQYAQNNAQHRNLANAQYQRNARDENYARNQNIAQIYLQTQSGLPRTSVPQKIRKKSTKTGPDDTSKDDKDKGKPHQDDPLELALAYVGEMGVYQWYLFALMMPFGFFYSWVYFVQMFIAATPSVYYCRIPALAHLPQDVRRNLSVPIVDGRWDRCQMFNTDWRVVVQSGIRPSEDTPKVECQHGWEYEFTDIPYPTVATERNWVCNDAKNVPTSQSLTLIGSVFGCFMFGWMADHYGRVPALMGSNLCGAIGGIATIFTAGYWDYVFCRFIVSMALDNNFMLIYILALEYVGPSYRTAVANVAYALYFGSGNASLPWIAYYCCDWRKTLWVTSLPMFMVIFAPWFMPESARWLASRGKIDEATTVLRSFAAVNGNIIPKEVMEKFITNAKEEYSQHVEESLWVIFKSALLRQTFIYMVIAYCSCCVMYDAIVRLSGAFGLDFFITYTIGAAMGAPSILVVAVFLDKFGRRNLSVIPLFLSGLTFLTAMAVPRGLPRVGLAVLARFLTNMTISAETQWWTEILPTPFRASGSAALHMAAYAICLLSPFIVYSRNYFEQLPYIILGIVAIVSAGLTLFLPETKGLEIPQTILDSENIIAENMLFRPNNVFSNNLCCTVLIHKEEALVIGLLIPLANWELTCLRTTSEGSRISLRKDYLEGTLLVVVAFSDIGNAIIDRSSLLMPETKGEEMPQTVADAEDIIKENSLYGPRE